MANDRQLDAALALHRFGFGPRGDAIAKISSDPRGTLLAELDQPNIARLDAPDLLASGAAARATFEFRQERKAARLAQRASQATAMAQGDAERPNAEKPRNPGPGLPQQLYLAEAKARFDRALAADIGFVERLVWFWSNHFCVSADKVRPIAGAFEREAIRPHVLGRFADMLLAVESHPAMLHYLDNARSIGPDSMAGRNRGKGLNENLAREILELHTLGVRSVYTQEDVTSFAKVLTGWTIIPPASNPDRGNEFVFNPRMHEPGAETVAGHSYADSGFEQGRAVLLDLARHPATAQHIASKLARHFIADEPPPALVERLTKCFLDTDGDLKEIAKALVDAPETWSIERVKLKRPSEWLVSAWRGIGVVPDAQPALRAMGYLGERMWRPPAPQGYADVQAAWIDGLAQRLDIANRIAELVQERTEPETFIEMALGSLASDETRKTIARAESRQQALTLAFMSPEFQRR